MQKFPKNVPSNYVNVAPVSDNGIKTNSLIKRNRANSIKPIMLHFKNFCKNKESIYFCLE